MQPAMKILLTAGLGAATMYYLDPAQGRERRDLARERLEYGRDRLEHASHTAKVVGHDVGERTERALHGLRAVGQGIGDRAGRTLHRAQAVRHDVGRRAGRLGHGLRDAGYGARERAAGAASTLGSLFGRSGSNVGFHRNRKGRSALKLMGIPVKWLFVAGIGASAMYFFDPSQGLYRRVRFRDRFLNNRRKGMNGSGAPEDESAREATARPRSGDGPGLSDEERPLPG